MCILNANTCILLAGQCSRGGRRAAGRVPACCIAADPAVHTSRLGGDGVRTGWRFACNSCSSGRLLPDRILLRAQQPVAPQVRHPCSAICQQRKVRFGFALFTCAVVAVPHSRAMPVVQGGHRAQAAHHQALGTGTRCEPSCQGHDREGTPLFTLGTLHV